MSKDEKQPDGAQTDDTRTSGPTRRKVLGKIGSTVAVALAAPLLTPPVLAQQRAQSAGTALPQSVKRNPLTQYPRPPFPRQQQPWPGLVSRMVPRPDHGEASYQGSGRLLNRKALITGGDSGVGRAAAIAFAREGADVAINYLPAEESDAREVVALIRAAGRKAVALPGDIRSEAFCVKLVNDTVRELGLDILVNNAGKQEAQPSLMDITTEQFDATFKTNVYAMFWITRAALPHLTAGAAIINTTSEQAYNPSANLVDYAQTKACIVSFTKSVAKQLAKQGIRVNAVAPGPFWTPLPGPFWTPLQVTGGQAPADIPMFGSKTPLGRAGQPAELAAAYVVLASQESSYATGQIYGVNGGDEQP